MDISDTFIWKTGNTNRQHSFLLPRDIRAIIVGKSGYGKTTLLTSLLLEPGVLDYDNLVVRGKSLHQPEYKIIKTAFNKGLSKNQIKVLFQSQPEVMDEGGPVQVITNYDGPCKGNITASFGTDVTLDPKDYDPQRKNLLILDDIMLGPQNKIEQFFTRGRHNGIDIFYIAQSYFRLPRQTVRENANLFIFFRQCKKNLSHIFQDHSAADGISFKTFTKFCSDVWNQSKHNFVVIDLTRPVDSGKYRKNLSQYWSPQYDSLTEHLNTDTGADPSFQPGTMTHYHQIRSLADEERLLKQIIDLETHIRAQKERQRLKKNSRDETLTQIFEPITKTMQSLTHVATKHDLIAFDSTEPPKMCLKH